jgi:hypothetical protein
MDTVNEITSKPSSTQENSLSEIEKTSETTKNRNDDSSWLIENVRKKQLSKHFSRSSFRILQYQQYLMLIHLKILMK